MEIADLVSGDGFKPLPAENGGNGEMAEPICSELWHASAGPLTSLPAKGSYVVYFPQGHMEQVAASLNQDTEQQMPSYNIPTQIFCRVLCVKLHADQETDAVYAQLTLVPVPEPTAKSLAEKEEEHVHTSGTCTPHMFCKTLTVSDTSIHGGFSVPRRAAEDCFPPLDYKQERPSQELVAKDLHGVVWKFRHIYRGQPRRHLLTTGWSVFVSHKRLVSGDAILFLRDENGDLRLGIRRAAQQPCVIPSSVLSSQSMHLGLLAAAAHAVATKSMFHIFYNPRTSPAEFVVPYHKYVKSFNQPISIGMRFKMMFETEDAAERRYIGTITGIGDVEPSRWPSSKWRSLKVEWDEHAANERQERVSPWEIEPFISAAGSNHLAGPRIKKLRTSLETASTDSICDRGRLLDFDESSGFQKVLQGQELFFLKERVRDGVSLKKCQDWDYKQQDSLCGDLVVQKTGSESGTFGTSNLSPSSELFHTQEIFGPSYQSEALRSVEYLSSQCTDINQQHRKFIMQLQRKENACPLPFNTINYGSTGWGVSLSSFHTSQQVYSSKIELVEMPPSLGISAYKQGDLHGDFKHTFPFSHKSLQIGVPEMTTRWQDSFVSPSESEDTQGAVQTAGKLSRDLSVGLKKLIPPDSTCSQRNDQAGVEGNNKCKLFGISLLDEPACIDGVATRRISRGHSSDDLQRGLGHRTLEPVILRKRDGLEKVYHDHCMQLTTVESIERKATFQKAANIQNLVQSSGRSCKKVHKQGNPVGRAVDLSKFDGYDELIRELEQLFNMEGLLNDSEKGWQVVYTDNEGDLMLVGDDPWPEFCKIVCKILIYTVEEMQKMTPGCFGNDALSCSEEQPATVKVSKHSFHHQDSSSRVTTGMT